MRDKQTDLNRLRSALRSEADSAVLDAVAAPLIARHFEDLLDFSDRLVASNSRRRSVEGGDLASEAWVTALRRLASPDSQEIVDEEHFRRLLFRIAQSRFYDVLDRDRSRDEVDLDASYAVHEGEPGGALSEQLVARERAEENLFFGEGGRFLPFVEAVFQGDEAMRALAVERPNRRAKQFQAMILFFLAEHFREEIGTSYSEAAEIFRRYLQLLGIPEDLWMPVEGAALDGGGDEALFEAVNQVCGTALWDRQRFSNLRYELMRLVGERGRG